jgi:hypothetical protein
MAHAASTGDHGCPRENGPGFGLPVETRQNARSIVGMPACGTHPGDGALGGIVKGGPRPGVAPVTARHVRPAPRRAPVPIPQYPALGRDPRIPARSSAAGAADGRSNHHLCHVQHPSDPAVLTGMPGSRPRCARRSTNGPCMKARGSPPGRWNLAGREPRQNMPRSARQLPGEAIQAGSAPAPAASTVRSITGTPPRIPGEWGVDRRSRAVGGWLWDGRVTWTVEGRPELPTVRGTT